MVQSNDFMRAMNLGEEAEVEQLLQKAFRGNDEARLVRLLRKHGAMAGEMVVTDERGIAGYLALSEFVAPKGWLCLAPVAVRPELQGRGIGRRMTGLLTEWARLAGKTVVVLGEVEFYQRGGFNAARAAGLTSPYPIEHTLLAGPGEDTPEVELIYPKAFSAL
ncbi:N-acetyltransferase [Alisedimentitalea sp. MJ-SS2]|uniref:GNAT family N-acetyltransferase n=1 Tax=Aliisedimentitalea sp. MJ-SS2 TaxID=3049795 RepID=UPI002911350D|nr:N-acetyltransferase [Alisedimentitalea sp. MJ-SS2]MDU8927253.1 N-acetyltransferase [Alisedimentitalea sp. MJ-SS2]